MIRRAPPARRWLEASLVLAALGAGCRSTAPVAPLGVADPHLQAALERARASTFAGPRLRILGTAQDGGFPHVACRSPRCESAREDPRRARWASSVAVLQPETGARWIIDASPDLPEQLQLLPPRGDGGASALLDRSPVDRSPVDGVLLTHAHIGHYLGLAFFGFEAVHTQELPVHATPAMSDFLSAHAPWQQLVQRKNIALRPSPAGVPFELGTLEVTPLAVPHRDEYADTVAYRLRGARATILYLPDCAPWASWSTDPLAIFADVDVALVDGTFFSPDELPGRRLEETGHPLMRDTMDLLGPAVANKRLRVTFVHLNHSNPAVVPESPEAREVLRRGFAIAADGDEFPL